LLISRFWMGYWLHVNVVIHCLTSVVCFCSPSRSDNFNMIYKNICGVCWDKTSHTHSGDIRDIFYILWKGHYTTPLIEQYWSIFKSHNCLIYVLDNTIRSKSRGSLISLFSIVVLPKTYPDKPTNGRSCGSVRISPALSLIFNGNESEAVEERHASFKWAVQQLNVFCDCSADETLQKYLSKEFQ